MYLITNEMKTYQTVIGIVAISLAVVFFAVGFYKKNKMLERTGFVALVVGLLVLLIVANVDKKNKTTKQPAVTISLDKDKEQQVSFSFQESGCELQNCTFAYCSVFCSKGGRIRIYNLAESSRTQVGDKGDNLPKLIKMFACKNGVREIKLGNQVTGFECK